MTTDYRIRFDAPLIDFATNVGLSGQAHDDFPGPNQQARYDWMRIYLIGLLSSQASSDPPNQFREGTPWFDLNDATIKIRKNGAWVSFAEAIKLADTETPNQPFTLQDWFNEIQSVIGSLRSELFFQGTIVTPNVTLIPIPTNLQGFLQSNSRPFVYANGVLINPAVTTLQPGPNPTAIEVPAGSLPQGSEFVVVIKFIPNSRFNVATVTV